MVAAPPPTCPMHGPMEFNRLDGWFCDGDHSTAACAQGNHGYCTVPQGCACRCHERAGR